MEAALYLTTTNPFSSSSPPLPPAKANLTFLTPPTSTRWPRSLAKPGNAVPSPLHMMFRSTAALILRNMAPRCGAEPEPDPEDTNSKVDSDIEAEGSDDGGEDGEEELAEELECLVEEAMAGQDEGRAPADYDRRAHIFDESSRVFHARKDRLAGH